MQSRVLKTVAVCCCFCSAGAQSVVADVNPATRSQRIAQLLSDQETFDARLQALENHHDNQGIGPQVMKVTNNATRSARASGRRLGVYSDDEIEATVANIAVVAASSGSSRQLWQLAALMTQVMTMIGDLGTCLDYMWLLVAGSLVMFMQAGFALLESGSVRYKNGGMVLMKNMADVCLGTAFWYLLGYGLAFGKSEDPNEFIGTQQFAGEGFITTDADGVITGTSHLKDWFFQWTFCATSATIVSGSVAERIRFPAYVIYSCFMCVFIYPAIVYWTWSGSGWLTIRGYSDFAGSGIVHLTGGSAALVAAALLGARKGRWEDPDAFQPHNMSLVVLGTFILWFGWYGFNCGSTLSFSDVGTATQAGLVAMNTTLAGSLGGITVGLLRLRTNTYDLAGMCNGILCGLVACCAGVGDMQPHLALVTGILGGLAYESGHILVLALRVDDPLDAFAVHGCGGMMGLIVRPIFDRRGFQGEMLAWHIVAIFVIAGWSGGLSAIALGTMRVMGILRADDDEEFYGGDSHISPRKGFVIESGEGVGSHVDLPIITPIIQDEELREKLALRKEKLALQQSQATPTIIEDVKPRSLEEVLSKPTTAEDLDELEDMCWDATAGPPSKKVPQSLKPNRVH